MDHGRILDQGRHVDLLTQNERYASLISTFLHEDNEANVDEVVSDSDDERVTSQKS